MRGRIHSIPDDLRLDFIRKHVVDGDDNISLPAIKKRYPRLYKHTSRDHDISDLDDPHIVDLMRKGTIPPSLSLRAPPAHIGSNNHRNDIIGITKEECSKRYIIKLRNERARNNEAVFKSLDNLPVKIRQVAQSSLVKSAGTNKSSSTSRSKLSSRSLPQSSRERETKSLDPPWMKNNAMNPRKQRSKLKTLPRVDLGTAEKEKSKASADEFFNVSFEPNPLNSELPYIFSTGFQGYQNRVRVTKKKPIVAFGKTTTISSSYSVTNSRENNEHYNKNNHEFQRRYRRVLDSNQQPHFVKASLLKGQGVSRGYKKVNHLLGVTENDHREELFAIKSVQRMNQPTIFTSPASPTRVPHPSLYSEGQYSDLSDNINGDANSTDSRERSSTIADVDSRENSYNSNQDNQDEKKCVEKDRTDTEVPKLSLELLRVHESTTSAQAKKTNQACNLTDITERDESNLTKTTKSEVAPDMKISVRINYKSKEDAIEEHHSIISASSVKSRETLTPRAARQNASSESKRSLSNVSHSALDNIRVQGRVYGEISETNERQEENVSQDIGEHYKSLSSDDETEIPMIVVDLNNLQTVKTKKRKTNKVRNGSAETKQTTASFRDPVRRGESETVNNEKAGDFFLTYEDPDSPLSNYDDPLVGNFRREDNVAKKDATPRTEVDDSGISISTYENETIKC